MIGIFLAATLTRRPLARFLAIRHAQISSLSGPRWTRTMKRPGNTPLMKRHCNAIWQRLDSTFVTAAIHGEQISDRVSLSIELSTECQLGVPVRTRALVMPTIS